MRSVCAKAIPHRRRYNLQTLICVAPLSISKEKKSKEAAKRAPSTFPGCIISISLLWKLLFYMQGLCQFAAFANYSPLETLGLKIKIWATKVTLLAPFWTRSLTSFQREMHVFVFARVEENERSNREGTGFRGQINNGLLTATLLPVICMQRSVEKVNVQKDTNSTIISRPENTLHHTLRHERNSCGFTNILHTVTAHSK